MATRRDNCETQALQTMKALLEGVARGRLGNADIFLHDQNHGFTTDSRSMKLALMQAYLVGYQRGGCDKGKYLEGIDHAFQVAFSECLEAFNGKR